MSRSGYSDDCDSWDLIRWRGAVAAAIKGKRGQAFLLEMWRAMAALPEKKLIADELEIKSERTRFRYDKTTGKVIEQGVAVCAIGSVGKARGIDMRELDPEDREKIAEAFGISYALACEIMFLNDGDGYIYSDDPHSRFARIKRWIEENLRPVEET